MSGLSAPWPFSFISAATSAIRSALGRYGGSRNIRPNRPSYRGEDGR
jgi:hypothetical protein